MERKALQIRLDPRLHEQIGFFAHAVGTSMNHLVVDAVNAYLQQLSVQLDAELTETLDRVRVYSRSQEAEDRDLEAFVDSEMNRSDPAEGSLVAEPRVGTTSNHLGRILAGLG